MGFTYSGDPSQSAKDQVRFYIGDTEEHDPLLQDGEIEFVLAQYNNVTINASIKCTETIMAKWARQVNEQVGQVRIDFSDRIKNMNLLKTALIARLATEDITPFAGGISKSSVRTVAQNGDRVPPDFTKHMMENEQIAPWVSNSWTRFGDQTFVEEA